MKLISRYKWHGSKLWTQWEVNEGAEQLTKEECEMLIAQWAKDGESKVGQYGDIYKVQDEVMTEEFRIVLDRLDITSYNQIRNGTYLM